jgi:RNA polymerase sigma-70 factor (ECF subfamily)
VNAASGDRAGADVEGIYRRERRQVLATLIRLLGDFDRAEEALHDAFLAAAARWPNDGVPDSPRAWLVSAGRYKAIDRLRRQARFAAALPELTMRAEPSDEPADEEHSVRDDQLRLIFTCCNPALSGDAQVALTLREVCGLTTEAVAHAFLVPAPTIAQRIVRAKAKIREAGIPYVVPDTDVLPRRVESVLRVVYLVFNEGYFASTGDVLARVDLTSEAIRLGRLLVSLLPDVEVIGLLALMLLHDSRRAARVSPTGDVVLFADQDRSLWDLAEIAEGSKLATAAFASGEVGPYAIHAAIAATHAESVHSGTVDWPRIIRLYDLLLRAAPSPVVHLNRAVAVAMRDGANAGLELIDTIVAAGMLRDYPPAHSARADLLRRLGQVAEAQAAYRKALALTQQAAERRFLEARLRELAGS